VRQLRLSLSRSCAEKRDRPWCPVTRPAATTASTPEACSSSAGMKATNGTVNDTAVVSTGSSRRMRTCTDTSPTTMPTAAPTTTANAKSHATSPSETAPAVAAIAVRSSTSAVASLTRPSPSSTVTSRGGSPSFLPTDVAATASGGETTAPSAIEAASPRPGTSACTRRPTSTADTITSPTDSAVIVPRSRRKSVTFTWTAAEYRIGGRTTMSTRSGRRGSSGAPGSMLSPAPTSTSPIGAAMPNRGANRATATTTRTATTPRVVSSISTVAPPSSPVRCGKTLRGPRPVHGRQPAPERLGGVVRGALVRVERDGAARPHR